MAEFKRPSDYEIVIRDLQSVESMIPVLLEDLERGYEQNPSAETYMRFKYAQSVFGGLAHMLDHMFKEGGFGYPSHTSLFPLPTRQIDADPLLQSPDHFRPNVRPTRES